MKLSKTSFSFIITVFCLYLVPATSIAKIYHLTILHTNDHRGHFMKFSLPDNPDIGGMAARSTLINTVRAEIEQAGGHVLLLSAGNVNIGAPESNLLNAEPDFKLMNMLGYDAMTPGHGDFCKPREVLLQQREWAGFPFLSANMVKKETGEPLLAPYIIKQFDGLNVSIFGLTQEIIPEITIYAKDLDGRSVIEIAQTLVPKLRTEADVIIALTNLGLSEMFRTPNDIQLAQMVPEIDVIVGGGGGSLSGTITHESET